MKQSLHSKTNGAHSKEPPLELDDEQLIEGGEITELDATAYRVDPIKKHHVLTASALAYLSLGILTFSVVAHYGITIWLAISGNLAVIDIVERTFNAWIPVISGFAGAAITYFFTKERA